MFNTKNGDSLALQDNNWGVTPSLDSKSCPRATHPFGADGSQKKRCQAPGNQLSAIISCYRRFVSSRQLHDFHCTGIRACGPV